MKLIINDVGVDPAILELELRSLESLREEQEQHPKLISFTGKRTKKMKGKVHRQVHKVLGYGLHPERMRTVARSENKICLASETQAVL